MSRLKAPKPPTKPSPKPSRTARPPGVTPGRGPSSRPAPGATPAAARSASGRGGDDRGWLFGTHAVLAALANPARRCRRLVATAEALAGLAGGLEAVRAKRGSGLPEPEVMTRAEMDAVVPGAVHQGLLLRCDPLPAPGLDELCALVAARPAALVVLLDQVTDPQNVGAILRSAAAFAALAVVVTDRHAPEMTGSLVKAASGAAEVVPLVRVANLSQALDRLKAAGMWALGLDGHAEKTLTEVAAGPKVAVVMGAEGAGLRRLTREHCDLLVRLPISEAVESLNVSAAAAVTLYALAWARD